MEEEPWETPEEGTVGSPGSLQPARGQAGDLGKGTQIHPAPGSCLIPWVAGQRGDEGEGRESPPGAWLLQSGQGGGLEVCGSGREGPRRRKAPERRAGWGESGGHALAGIVAMRGPGTARGQGVRLGKYPTSSTWRKRRELHLQGMDGQTAVFRRRGRRGKWAPSTGHLGLGMAACQLRPCGFIFFSDRSYCPRRKHSPRTSPTHPRNLPRSRGGDPAQGPCPSQEGGDMLGVLPCSEACQAGTPHQGHSGDAHGRETKRQHRKRPKENHIIPIQDMLEGIQ